MNAPGLQVVDWRLGQSEATSWVCQMPRPLLITIINSFTVDTCQGWTRPWLDQLPGLYILPDHMGHREGDGWGRRKEARERVFVIEVAGGSEETDTVAVSFQPGSHWVP